MNGMCEVTMEASRLISPNKAEERPATIRQLFDNQVVMTADKNRSIIRQLEAYPIIPQERNYQFWVYS